MNVNVGYQSPGFDVNDLGFQQRADQIPQNSWLQIRWNTPGKYKRNRNINFNQWSAHNFDGDRLGLGGNINSHWTFQNQLEHGRRRQLQRRELRRPSDARRAWRVRARQRQRLALLQHRRPARRQLQLELQFLLRRAGPQLQRVAGHLAAADGGVLGRIRRQLRQRHRRRAVGRCGDRVDGTTHYVFGRLDQKTSSITARVNYTMTPNLSLQVYAQPFVVGRRSTTNYKELVNGRADDYDDRYAPFAYDGNAGLQGAVVPHHERDALGVQARLDAVRRLAAGARGPRHAERLPLRPATSATSSPRPRPTRSSSSSPTGSIRRSSSASVRSRLCPAPGPDRRALRRFAQSCSTSSAEYSRPDLRGFQGLRGRGRADHEPAAASQSASAGPCSTSAAGRASTHGFWLPRASTWTASTSIRRSCALPRPSIRRPVLRGRHERLPCAASVRRGRVSLQLNWLSAHARSREATP